MINIENSFAVFRENYYTFFRTLWWMESWKDQHLFEIEIFRSILNVFTVNVAGFNAYLRAEVESNELHLLALL